MHGCIQEVGIVWPVLAIFVWNPRRYNSTDHWAAVDLSRSSHFAFSPTVSRRLSHGPSAGRFFVDRECSSHFRRSTAHDASKVAIQRIRNNRRRRKSKLSNFLDMQTKKKILARHKLITRSIVVS